MRRSLTALAAAAFALAASAQAQNSSLALADSPALRCLTPAVEERGKPAYPETADALKLGATVDVELRFDGPDERPAVEVLDPVVGDDFIAAVRSHVRKFRVPCMQPGEGPVRLRQRYLFSPSGRQIHYGAPLDVADSKRRDQIRCITRARPNETPDYPKSALRDGEQGRVLLLLRFDSADGPPKVRNFARREIRRLAAHAQGWAEDYRMPCYSGQPIEVTWSFLYRIDGESPPVFKDLELVSFLRAVKGIGQQTLKFDFNTMGCPFAVKLTYLRPHLPNRVGQLDNTRLERQVFVDWLTSVEFNLPPHVAEGLLGDNLFISVPCTVLDLKPQEKS